MTLTWSKQPPTEPGWYWVVHPDYGRIVVRVYPILHVEGTDVPLSECSPWHHRNGKPEWAGPLPEPEDGDPKP